MSALVHLGPRLVPVTIRHARAVKDSWADAYLDVASIRIWQRDPVLVIYGTRRAL